MNNNTHTDAPSPVETYIELYHNGDFLENVKVVDGRWKTNLTLPSGEHDFVAKLSALSSTAWKLTVTNPDDFDEDFQTVPLGHLPVGRDRDIGRFTIHNILNGMPTHPNSIGTNPPPNNYLTISGKLRIILKAKNARLFTCIIHRSHTANIFRFYDEKDNLIETFSPHLPYEPTSFTPSIERPYSVIEIETAATSGAGGTVDYIELDNISVRY